MSEVFTSPAGRIKNNYDTVAMATDTTVTINIAVPANRRWHIESITCDNPDTVTRTLIIRVRRVSDGAVLEELYNAALGAGGRHTELVDLDLKGKYEAFSETDANAEEITIILVAGSGGTTGTVHYSTRILEVEV